jgi:hypothetical protein
MKDRDILSYYIMVHYWITSAEGGRGGWVVETSLFIFHFSHVVWMEKLLSYICSSNMRLSTQNVWIAL